MKVSELRKGMLLRPKEGTHFQRWVHPYDANSEALKCLKTRSRTSYRVLAAPTSQQPIIYLGKAPKAKGYYEYRHRVYVPSLGRELRVVSECWRNVEEAK